MKYYFAFFIFFFISCDFSSKLHQDVLAAQKALYEQKYLKAVKLYQSIAVRKIPEKIKIRIFFQLGDIYVIHLGDPLKAREFYRKIKTLTEDPSELVKTEKKLGEINFSYLKIFDQAIRNYKNLFEFTPPLVEQDFYQFRLGHSYLEARRYDDARKVFSEIQNNQNHKFFVESFYYLGLSFFHERKWKNALLNWEKYIKLEKQNDKIVNTKFLMANIYETIESLEKAYDLYYSILGEYPNTEVLKNRLKSLYSRRIFRKR